MPGGGGAGEGQKSCAACGVGSMREEVWAEARRAGRVCGAKLGSRGSTSGEGRWAACAGVGERVTRVV